MTRQGSQRNIKLVDRLPEGEDKDEDDDAADFDHDQDDGGRFGAIVDFILLGLFLGLYPVLFLYFLFAYLKLKTYFRRGLGDYFCNSGGCRRYRRRHIGGHVGCYKCIRVIIK